MSVVSPSLENYPGVVTLSTISVSSSLWGLPPQVSGCWAGPSVADALFFSVVRCLSFWAVSIPVSSNQLVLSSTAPGGIQPCGASGPHWKKHKH